MPSVAEVAQSESSCKRAGESLLAHKASAAEFVHSKCLSVGKAALHGKRAQRVAPFPNLPRKDNNGENKATGTQSYKYLQVEMFFSNSCAPPTEGSWREATEGRQNVRFKSSVTRELFLL